MIYETLKLLNTPKDKKPTYPEDDEDEENRKQPVLVHTERWRSKVWGQTTGVVLLQKMKTAIALAALLGVGTAPALAGGFYVNAEANSGFTGSDYTSTTTDLHIGYEGGNEGFGYYIQGGPAFVAVDGADDTDTQLSGKLGATVAATDKLNFYGEVALLTDDDTDNQYATKLGAKYSF